MGRHRLAPDEVVRTLRALAAAATCLLALMPFTASADQDPKSLLAEPPSSDWMRVVPTAKVIDGPFSAHDYAAWLQAVGDTPSVAAGNEKTLNDDGFTAGYGREWVQQPTENLLVERVFVFGDTSGANDWYSGLKLDSLRNPNYVSSISTSAIPNSFGASLEFATGYMHQWRVDFVKGNLVFVIHTDSDTGDVSDLAVSQGVTEYQGAHPTGSAVPPVVGRVFGGIIAAIVVLAGAGIVIGLVLYFNSQRRHTAAAMAAGVQMSPDGSYWWDGSRWQPTATSAPPAAQRSPDGQYWWDGRSWRPVHAPIRPPVVL